MDAIPPAKQLAVLSGWLTSQDGDIWTGDIEMPVPFQEIQAAEIHALVPPKLLQQWGVHHDTEVFSFVVPELDFYVIGEQILPKPH